MGIDNSLKKIADSADFQTMHATAKILNIFLALAISGCATNSRRDIATLPGLNLKVYRIDIGRKSSSQPIAELFMPTDEFQKFLATREFRDREFRANIFYNGCYLFEHSDHRVSRAIASQKLADKNKAEPIFCYDSALDRFQGKSPLLP